MDLARSLGAHPPFDTLDEAELRLLARSAHVVQHDAGAQVLDAFVLAPDAIVVVVEGRVAVWNSADRLDDEPDEQLGPGGVAGFSALLTGRKVGPRVVAVSDAVVAYIPKRTVTSAFTTSGGARFLAEQLTAANAAPRTIPSYGIVDELIATAPLVVEPSQSLAEVARQMTRQRVRYAAVPLADGGFGLVTDALLREEVVAAGRPGTTPVAAIVPAAAPAAMLGESAAEAMIQLMDGADDVLLVVDRAGRPCGAIELRDMAASPTTAGMSLREQIRRASSVDELVQRSGRLPGMVSDLLGRGLASGKAIAVLSATVDAIVRRALALVLARHPELPADGFTLLALGSNGRREAVLSSDLDAAVAFDDDVPVDLQDSYRSMFAEVAAVLDRAGLSTDTHGATPRRAQFARTNAGWRAAAHEWLAAPELDNGAVLTSLLVDGRPIHGDPGLPEVTTVFRDLREHPATMRLLLRESLAHRAKGRSVRRAAAIDVKTQGLLPVVTVARWAALCVGSTHLGTADRLRDAAGSQMLPDSDAAALIEVFEVLQRLRLRHQLAQRRRGQMPTDVLTLRDMSPIDRSVLAQAVREIAAVQRRMDNIAAFTDAASWTKRSTPHQ